MHHKNTYTTRAMYNATDPDGFASITQKIVDRDLHDCYGV